jgi:hypothetical protein
VKLLLLTGKAKENWSGINLLDVGFFNLPHFKYAFTLQNNARVTIELRMQYGQELGQLVRFWSG